MIRQKVINVLKLKDLKYSAFAKRCFCNTNNVGNTLQHLSNRGLVRVSGNEVVPFLQGLITNDMGHLQEKSGCMYTLFLNTKGRVLYDSIIYSTDDPNSYLIECDSSVLDQFQKHLKMFRVKRKIDINSSNNKIWVIFNNDLVKNIGFDEVNCESLKGNIKLMVDVKINETCSIFNDPRTSALGARIICNESYSSSNITKHCNVDSVTETVDDDYKRFRYCLGIGEGVSDLPQGSCFPLEANADFLHGVSFHKGCYIGQELTARTYHTGVVRKRLMPLLFDRVVEGIEQESSVFGSQNDKTSLGKVRGISGNVGLGLLRVAQVSQEPHLDVSGNKAKTYKPFWWPEEAPKEKFSVG